MSLNAIPRRGPRELGTSSGLSANAGELKLVGNYANLTVPFITVTAKATAGAHDFEIVVAFRTSLGSIGPSFTAPILHSDTGRKVTEWLEATSGSVDVYIRNNSLTTQTYNVVVCGIG